ncbi:MAG: alpha/beta hydrolase, partial [Bryobacteraceae bacterium]
MDAPEKAGILIVALHGFAMNAEVMLRLTRPMVGADKIIASIEGPFAFQAQPNDSDSEVVFHWGTRAHRESTIRLHHDIVRRVLDDCRRRFSLPSSRCLLLGYSQPVGLNYRFAATWTNEVRGVIGICGGVPKNWEQGFGPTPAALLHIARENDEFYPAETSRTFPERLKRHASDVEFHMLAGAHRFPSKAQGIV